MAIGVVIDVIIEVVMVIYFLTIGLTQTQTPPNPNPNPTKLQTKPQTKPHQTRFRNGCVSLRDAIDSYDLAFDSPNGAQDNYASPPQPHYLPQDYEYCHEKSDLTYMLLKVTNLNIYKTIY